MSLKIWRKGHKKRGEVESLLDDSDADALKNAEEEVISRVFTVER